MMFIVRDGIIIYVGKNNLQNDYLTFKMASRNDMWFHVKDMPGYIIVHAENLDEYTMRLMPNIATYFSKGKYSSSVPVNYCLVKNLKKPHTNKPGLVLLGHYKTIYIDPDDSFYDELESGGCKMKLIPWKFNNDIVEGYTVPAHIDGKLFNMSYNGIDDKQVLENRKELAKMLGTDLDHMVAPF